MTVRATEILNAIQQLNPAEKLPIREYLIDAFTASSSTCFMNRRWRENHPLPFFTFFRLILGHLEH